MPIRAPITRPLLAATGMAAVLALAAAPAHAQASDDPHGPLLGAGGGVESIGESGGRTALSGAIDVRAGYRFSPSVALMLDAGLHGLNSERRRGDNDLNASTLWTSSVLVAARIGLPSQWYLQPGLGFGRHTFYAFYTSPCFAPGCLATPITSHEWGPAAGIAIGRTVNVPGFPLNVEAVGLWTHGEDSTRPRWSAGVQVVRELHF